MKLVKTEIKIVVWWRDKNWN